MRCLTLLSGGLDSCVASTLARKECDELFALTFVYGQRHSREVESARKIGKFLDVEEHRFVTLDPDLFITSSLVNKKLDVEERDIDEIGKDIPSTYVPARNIIFLSYALAFAESRDIEEIYIGVNALDYSGYPDCRPEFIEAFQRVAELGTRRGLEGRIRIRTPLIKMRKKEIIEMGIKIRAPLQLTWSCYRGRRKACGRCDACLLRLKGFKEAGYRDPMDYETFPSWYDPEKLQPIEF
ncbi:MAG TPA: 7-cyano-7-deazaguanine synthase QueC [Thermoplasmatales archaeon]|nr:7-cyano-7-deazaguanine synthase QueC [Thermoplasmatales archaeon]HEX17438.1 7-cyano-7-deazaguanine synthase QueC [Thermoplasmatales archaeon]